MRIIRTLVTATAASCLTLFATPIVAQDGGIVRAAESFEQQQPDMVQHAAPTGDQVLADGVAFADGSTEAGFLQHVAPIVTPDQMHPEKSSSMLAPMAKQTDDSDEAAIEDANVQPATAQWALNPNMPNPMSPQGAHRQIMQQQMQNAQIRAAMVNRVAGGAPIGSGLTQGSSTRNPLPAFDAGVAPGAQMHPNFDAGPPPIVSSGNAMQMPPIVSGGNVAPNYANSVVTPDNSALQPMAMPAQPMVQSNIPAMPAYETSAPMIGQPNFSGDVYGATSPMGCQSCNSNNCGGNCNSGGGSVAGCNSCGSGGCYDQSAVASRFGCSGSIPNASRYVMADALLWQFDDSSFAGGNFGGVEEHDFELGLRVTLGRRWDATAGDELVYTGVSEWRSRSEFNDPFGRLGANISVVPPFGAPESSALFNGTDQVQLRESNLHSLEYNRTRWGWDVVKTMVGFRGFYFRDRYQLFNDNGTDVGLINVEAENFMFGPQVGIELFYDVGYRLSYSFFGKGGLFFNANTLDTQVANAGRTVINRDETDSTFSYNFELGAIAHYQLTPQARLRAGYNLLWLYDVVSATDNFPSLLSVNTGNSTRDGDDLFFHGLSLGIEIYR